MIDMSILDMLYSQYGDGNYSNQQETLQRLNAMQQWQNPMMQQPQQQNRRYGPWDAIGQIAAAYARNQRQSQQQPQMQPQMQQMPQPAPQMDVGNGVSSVLENLMQSRGSDSLFRGW